MFEELCDKFRHYVEFNSAQNSRQRVNLFDYEEKQYLDFFHFRIDFQYNFILIRPYSNNYF